MKPRWKNFFVPNDRRPPWKLAAEQLRLKGSPLGDRYNPELTPWVKEPLELFPNNQVKEITCVCCVQGGKTQTEQIAQWWAMKYQPAPMMINCQTDDDAKDFAKERFGPMINSDAQLRAKLQTVAKPSVCSLSLSDMWILIHGANPSNLSSKSVRWVFNDEIYQWKGGLLQQSRDRATQFWNRRIFNASAGSNAGHDLEHAWQSGDCREWNLRCPQCDKLNMPKWERIKFPKFEGAPDFRRIKNETRFVCEHCSAEIEHTERNHRLMNSLGGYVATNPNPTPGHVSFRWNALALNPITLSWGDLAVEFTKALMAYEAGYEEPLREFKTKRLAEFWNPTVPYFSSETLPTSDYSFGDEWEKAAVFRVMAVDMQKDHFWFIIRDFAEDSTSRLVDCGKLLTWDSIVEKAIERKVSPQTVIVDSGHWAEEVYEACCAYGFRTLKGEDDLSFPWENGKAIEHRPYSKPREMQPGIGKPSRQRKYRTATLCRWSNPTIKNLLWRLQTGKGLYWGVPKDAPLAYLDQLKGETYRQITSKKTGKTEWRWMPTGRQGEHMRDCECMALVAAMIFGMFDGFSADTPKAEQPAE